MTLLFRALLLLCRSSANKWVSLDLKFLYVAQQPPVGQDLLSIDASWLHLETPRSVGLLYTSCQSDAETCA